MHLSRPTNWLIGFIQTISLSQIRKSVHGGSDIVNTRRKRFQKQLQLTDIFVMTYGFLLSSSSSTDTFLRTTRIYFEKLYFFQSQLVIRNHLLFIPGIGII